MWPSGHSPAFVLPATAHPAVQAHPVLPHGALQHEVAVPASSARSLGDQGSISSSVVSVAGTVAGLVAGALRRHSSRRKPQVRVARLAEGTAEASADAEESADFEGDVFPFSAVMGQEDAKLALILNMVDPVIGGVLIQGERGTGKSTAVRALQRLLPEIPSVAGDKYNSDPYNPNTMSDDARERYLAGEDLPVVMRKTPFVELPLGATEDRVTGTIDIERALLEGGKAFEPGILARVNRGILYIDEVNLLDDQLVDVLLDSAAGGWNTVEREGVSVRHPARFVLIGTAHPDEGDLRPQLLDRFGCTVGVRTPNDVDSRFQVLKRTSQWNSDPAALDAEFAEEDAALKAKILDARARLVDVKCDRELKIKISNICSRLNVDGLRGDIVTNRAARALAAFEGRTEVSEWDVRRVGIMTLQHRLRKNVVSDGVDNEQRVLEQLIREFPKAKASVEEVVEA